MRVNITRLYGIGTMSAAAVAMRNVNRIGIEMGMNELGLFTYQVRSDSDRDLSVRMDGILASVWHDDVFILQHPSWNDLRYEKMLVYKIRCYNNSKLIIFIHDVIPLMMKLDEDYLRECISFYNNADVLILPSEGMHRLLVEKGLTVKKVIYQEVWDYPIEDIAAPFAFERKIHFLGNIDRFPFIKNWSGKTSVEVYGNDYVENEKLIFNPGMESDRVVYKMQRHGFGLVWAGEEQKDYYRINQPFKLGTYLAAGLPVIVQEGTNATEFVKKNGIGFVVSSIEEVDQLVQSISEKEYAEIYDKVKNIRFLITNGYYTRKLLNEAVRLVLQ